MDSSPATYPVLPRLLYAGDVPVESTVYGAALLYRLLAAYPPERLMILESNACQSRPDRRLPGIQYSTFLLTSARLLNSRFHSLCGSWLLVRARAKWARLRELGRTFAPEAVLTVSHGHSWLAAAEYALRCGLPLHLVLHDNWPGTNLVLPFLRAYAHRLFGRCYQRAASRFCVSPAMAETYQEEFSVPGLVLYPSRALGSECYDTTPFRPQQGRAGPVIGYGGTVNGAGQALLLHRVAKTLAAVQGKLRIFGPLDRARAKRLKLDLSNIELRGLVSCDALIRGLRAETDALLVAMSFEKTEEKQQRISFPSKLADYTATGLPLLIVAPPYSSAVRWARENPGVAIVVSSQGDGSLEQAVRSLIDNPSERFRLAHQAIITGAKYFSYSKAWSTFSGEIARPRETVRQSQPPCLGHTSIAPSIFR